MEPNDLRSIRDVQIMESLRPYLEAEVDKQINAVQNRVLSQLERGELDPQLALNAWVEVQTLRKLVNKFKQTVRMGQSKGQTYASELENGLTNPHLT